MSGKAVPGNVRRSRWDNEVFGGDGIGCRGQVLLRVVAHLHCLAVLGGAGELVVGCRRWN